MDPVIDSAAGPEIDRAKGLVHSQTKLFLSGPFGSGKTTLAIERIRWLLNQERTRGDDILVIVPQRTLAQPYYDAIRSPDMPPGPPVRVSTFASLARNAIELYWPLIAGNAHFADPAKEPIFLNLETSQYHMARFVDAAIAQAAFDGIRVERARVISQVLDNMTKAALQGISIDDAYQRLELAIPSGEQQTARINALVAARQISHDFRTLCLHETIIDFSLQVELFNSQILTNDWSRTHLLRSHRHLVFDNIEEENVSSHRLATQWIPVADSALIVADSEAGYRLFLGADPEGVPDVAATCAEIVELQQSHSMSSHIIQLSENVSRAILGQRQLATLEGKGEGALDAVTDVSTDTDAELGRENDVGSVPPDSMPLNSRLRSPSPALTIPDTDFRFYPQMVEWVVDQIESLVRNDGVPPGEIAILAPYVSDALRFSLQTALTERGIDSTTHRPSRALQDEPAVRALLTLATLAHPDWGVRPAAADVTLTLALAIADLDPVRAHLLSRIVYPPRGKQIEVGRFGKLIPEMRQRITYAIGERHDQLREWLYAYRSSADIVPLDQFFARLFGEVLSQPGYGFHDEADAARIANQLVGSARNFRWALEESLVLEGGPASSVQLGREYLQLMESGALGALYVPGWAVADDAVFLAPAYTFLMRNRAVDIQFWIDIGSGGWWERLYQPLTHPYVLSPRWPANKPWSDFDEYSTRQDTMRSLLLGLLRRTRKHVYVGMSDYSESGFEQRGPLLMLINRLLAQG